MIKDDGLLAVFLTEPSFETWRKHSAISYEEESASKRVDKVEEVSIPSDLEDKLAYVLSATLVENASFWMLTLITASYAAKSARSLNSGKRSAFSPSA